MIKLLFLSFSFFMNLVNNFIIDVRPVNEDIIEVVEEAKLIRDNDEFIIKKGDLIIYRSIDARKVSFVLVNDVYYVLVTKDINSIIKIDKSGQVITSIELKNGYSNINITSNNNILYLYGELSSYSEEYISFKKDYMGGKDAFIQLFNLDLEEIAFKTYGGMLNEGFTKLKFTDEQIYLYGYKDELSGGDFGNGGNDTSGLFVILNFDLNIINFSTFFDLIIDINISKNITIILESGIIILDSDLNAINSTIFTSGCTFGGFMINDSVYILNDLGLNIYEKDSLEIVFNKEISVLYHQVINNNDYIMLYGEKNYALDIYDVRLFNNVVYHGYRFNDVIYGINDSLVLNNIEYNEYFNSQICGEYEVLFDFVDISILGKYIVLEEINISNDMVYPTGYRLLFTGTAYLNGKLINNNHSIVNPGSYRIEIFDLDGNSKEYKILVEGNQKDVFEVNYSNWDYMVQINNNLKIRIDSSVDNLIGVYANNEKILHYHDDNGYYISTSYDSIGLKKFDIDYLEYLVDDIVFKKFVNMSYFINVIDSNLEVDTYFNSNNLVFSVDSYDQNKQIRSLRVIVRNNEEEFEYMHTITDKVLIVRNLNENLDYEVLVDLVYCFDGKNYEYYNIFKVDINGYKEFVIGSIEKTKTTDVDFNFNIHLKDQNFRLSNNDGLLYINQRKSNIIYYVSGLLIGVIAFSVIIIIRKKPKWLRK